MFEKILTVRGTIKFGDESDVFVRRGGETPPLLPKGYFSVLINASIRSKAWLMCLTE